MTWKKILGIGVLAAAVMLLATTAMAAATAGITNPAMAQQQANPTTALFMTEDQAVTTEVAGTAIFMGDCEANEGLLKGPVALMIVRAATTAFFMTDDQAVSTEVDNPADGNMVGFIHTPTATPATTPAAAQGTNGV